MSSRVVTLLATLGGPLFGLTSCGSTSDCVTRHDCVVNPGGASGEGGRSGNAGSTGASGTANRAGSTGSAGSSGDSGADGVSSTCDGSKSPDVESCVISDDYGVFVSAAGDDTTGNGTEAAPYATLTTALSKLDAIRRIYVCASEDEYNEPTTLEIPGDVAIYGGFGCEGGAWTYDSANNKATFKPMSPIGAVIKKRTGVSLMDLTITAGDATSPSGSSFGLMVISSDDVALTRVVIKSGKGAPGRTGANGEAGVAGTPSTAAQDGQPGSCTLAPATLSGGRPIAATCESQGGAGGEAYISGVAIPGQGGPGSPIILSNGGAGGTVASNRGEPGTAGKLGADGQLGQPAASIGTFSPTGYVMASGAPGLSGNPGQGGGGGGASFAYTDCVGSSGGAGGMGGCGGGPGMGGVGGGASVALLSWASSVHVNTCTLTAIVGGAGGAGGVGNLGGLGQAGGSGGTASAGIKSGGRGGDGGPGGDGGSGSGGTGGPSIAIVYDGTEPIRKDTLLEVPAKGGAAGQGGHFGTDTSRWAPDGSIGLAQAIYTKTQ